MPDVDIRTPLVLIAEDEPLLRMIVAETFRDAGCDVLEAENGDEAITLLIDYPHIEALVTDVEMPSSVDGFQLATLVHSHRPDIAIIVASGRVTPSEDVLPPGTLFFSKPYEQP